MRSHQDDLSRELQDSVALQWTETTSYCASHAPRFVLHLLLIALLAVGLRWAGFWLRPYTRKEPELRRTALIFRVPLATAVALSIGATHWIYPFAPPLLVALLGAVALVPTRIILRRLIDRQLLPILDMLVVFYFVDLLRTLFAPLLLLTRLLFLAEMCAGALVMGWLLRSVADVRSPALKRGLATFGGLAFVLAFLAAALGYVALGNLIGNTALQAAYLGVVIYSASHIANGLILLGVHMPPFGLLGSIRSNRELIRVRVTRLVSLCATLLWLAGVLQLLSLRQAVLGGAVTALGTGVQIGALHVTVGDVLAFPVVIWLAIQLSRFMRFVLEEDIYPRVTLPRGVPYALSTMLHYCILALGFIVALTAAGIDTSRFTLVVGALGVGIGLGLQNIVQNLVSGLILLFERPFQVGDCITFREFEGDVTSIGLRATVLKTTTGADVIVPNGMLVSSEVVNWTLVGRHTRRMDLDVPVPHDVDIPRVVALLNRVCAASTFVASRPLPRTIISEIRETAIILQVQVWMADASNTSGTRNDIYRRVEAAFTTAKIKTPVTDVRLRLDSLGTELKDFLREWPRR